MNEEIMQLISLVKNDEVYFKRIEELKAKQLEVAHATEIAKTLKQAEMYLANARQQGEEILEAAKKEVEDIRAAALVVLAENKVKLEKNKAKEIALKEKEEEQNKVKEELVALEKTLTASIEQHRQLTAERSIEQEAAKKVRAEFETKLKKLKEVANS